MPVCLRRRAELVEEALCCDCTMHEWSAFFRELFAAADIVATTLCRREDILLKSADLGLEECVGNRYESLQNNLKEGSRLRIKRKE